MKRLALILVCFSTFAAAQNTTVSGVVTDPNGVPYAFGTIQPTLVNNAGSSPRFTSNGQFYVAPSGPTRLDATGAFTMLLADNALLTPAATQWQFTAYSGAGSVPAAAGNGSVCFQLLVAVTITGASQSITTQLNLASALLGPVVRNSLGRAAIGDPSRNFSVTPATYFDDPATAVGLNVSYLLPNSSTFAGTGTGLNVVAENQKVGSTGIIGGYFATFGNVASGTAPVIAVQPDAEAIGGATPSLLAAIQTITNTSTGATTAVAVDAAAPTKSGGSIATAIGLRVASPSAGNSGGNIAIQITPDNCTSASPAVCGNSAAGAVALAAAATTLTVNTTAVTANSKIMLQEDSSLGTKLSVTCNTTTGRIYTVSTRTAGTSFVITASAAPAANPACLSYVIFN